MEENNNLPQNETKTSNAVPEIDFDNMTLDEKLSMFVGELDIEIKNFDRLVGRLSKKQLERVLRKTLHYPMSQIAPSADEAERFVGSIATKIEHLKILIIKTADDLDKQQKEENNGNKE
jgi:hypothetical protein